VLDAAVLLEAGWDEMCHEVWTTIVPQDEVRNVFLLFLIFELFCAQCNSFEQIFLKGLHSGSLTWGGLEIIFRD
jgi:hypothetical protein